MRYFKKLGVNIDHVATLRQARGGSVPSPLKALYEIQKGGADGVTVHLREDRRHIQDYDLKDIRKHAKIPLNMEMALTGEMVRIALKIRPDKVCLVPEKRAELTTEGGLDAFSKKKDLRKWIPLLRKNKIQVSLFIEPSEKQIRTAQETGAHAIEIHTGAYANRTGAKKQEELTRIRKASQLASSLGLMVHAGHGLDYQNTAAVAAISEIEEFNIGHSIISYSVFAGLKRAVSEMKTILQKVRG